ncbi:MAG: hypothetical protein ACXQTE_00845 [Methanosarcinaceae archaeon]
MNEGLFVLVLLIHIAIGFVLSHTKVGRMASTVYALSLMLIWFLKLPVTGTGDINADIEAIKIITISGTNLIIQLVMPSWIGLAAGTVSRWH